MSKIKEPTAPKKEHIFEEFGNKRVDNYYWMNQRDSKPVLKYIEEENNYTKEVMMDTEELQNQLYLEITARIQEREESVPYFFNGYWYYSRFEEGKEYQINFRKKGSLEAKEEVLIDQNELAKDKSYFALGGLQVSPNNRLLAYGYDDVSRRQYKIRVMDLETGKLYDEIIENTSGGAYWANDNKTIFYVIKDPQTLRTFKVMRHTLGTNPSQDVVVFEENDDTFDAYVSRSKSGKFIWVQSQSTLSSEVMFIDADNPMGDLTVINKREKEHEYEVSHHKDNFYIKTNWNAKNFRIMKCPINNFSKENWVEIIPNREDILIEDLELFDDYLVIEERKEGLINLRVIGEKSEHYINFGEPTYYASLGTNPNFDTKNLRFVYSSLSTPNSVFDYNMESKEKTLLKESAVLGGFNKDDYQVERIYATARDGIKVPISLVFKKGLLKDGNNPLVLYGYGSYGISIDAGFNFDRLSLLDRGFVYAIAHIRGGEELGRQWYENGKLLNKKNTFYDFIDCAKYLIENKYTNNNKIFAVGGSAGGLLMGAVLNMEPTLFKGILAAVPFVDVMTTMFDESIPLTTSEYDEWGNPKNETYYRYMLSYSPIDNIEAKPYTNLLITTGYHDSQVQYWEPLKWVAKLRDYRTDKSKFLMLNTQMEAGHGGASGRYRRFKEKALEYSFFLKLLEDQK
jgi:oligopeptidase B